MKTLKGSINKQGIVSLLLTFIKSLSLVLIAIFIFACGGQETKQIDKQQKVDDPKQEVTQEKPQEKPQVETVVEEEENDIGMSEFEASVLDMMKSAYERNSEDLLVWSELAGKVKDVEQAINVMNEYVEVQKIFNKNINEIEDIAGVELGKDHVYSADYNDALQSFLSNPERIERSKGIVNATMKLINTYGHIDDFQVILKELEEINKHRMKELNEDEG